MTKREGFVAMRLGHRESQNYFFFFFNKHLVTTMAHLMRTYVPGHGIVVTGIHNSWEQTVTKRINKFFSSYLLVFFS